MTVAPRLVPICAAALLLAGCSPLLDEGACTADIRFGLNVTVVDSATDVPPASAVLIAQSGLFVDSVGPVSPVQNVQNGPAHPDAEHGGGAGGHLRHHRARRGIP